MEETNDIDDPDECQYRIIYRHYRLPAWLNLTRATPKVIIANSERWTNRGWMFMNAATKAVAFSRPYPGSSSAPAGKGGYTECVVLDEGGAEVAVGVAVCSLKDSFEYKVGRDLALGRAMEKLYGD